MYSAGDLSAWAIGAGFITLAGVYAGNALQSYGSKLADGRHAAVSLSGNYAIHWARRKLTDVAVCFAAWWLVSWGLALGKGDASLLIGGSEFALIGMRSSSGGYALTYYTFTLLVASAGILSEAVGDSTGPVQPWIIIAYSIVVFPFIFHWAWSDHGWASPFRSSTKSFLLAGCGVIDSAGSSVIHLAGGVSAATISLLLFDYSSWQKRRASEMAEGDGGKRIGHHHLHTPPSSSANFGALLHTIGTILVWSGSYGFHALNNLPLSSSSSTGGVAGKRVAVTTVGASCACATAFILAVIQGRGQFTSRDVFRIGRCTMTGLAAMGACCSSCEFEGAFAIGVIAALMNLGCENLLQLLDVDDASGAISIHIVGGAWGLFAAGLLTSQQGYADSFASSYGDGVSRSAFCRGAFYGGRGNQLGANIVFILATISWSWALTLASTLPFKLLWPSHFAVADFNEDAKLVADSQHFSSVIENSKLAEVKRENASLVKLQTAPASPLPPIVRTPAKETPASKVEATTDPKNNEKKKPGTSSSLMMLKTAALGAMSFKKGDKKKGGGAKEEIEVGELEAFDTLEEEEAFEKENGYSWDLAIVFKAPTYPDGNPKVVISFTKDKPHTAKNPATGVEEPIMTAAEIITNLSAVGLHTRCFHSLDKKYIICKIRAPLSILKACADIGDVKLLLDEEELQRQAEAGWSGIHNEKSVTIRPLKISYGWEEHLTTYTPYEYIYSTFDDPDAAEEEKGDDEKDALLKQQTAPPRPWPTIYAKSKNLKHGVNHGFGAVQRIKLLHGILTHTGEKGCGLDLRKLQEEHEQILGCFPLHDAEIVELLRERWLGWNVMPWNSPWKKIKEYFGEKIGLYFMFLGHYCNSLGTVSFLGFFVVIHLIVVGVQNNSLFESLRYMYSIPPYCFFITLWSQWFLETWAKKEKNVALQWGMVGFESTEETRPEYEGKLIDSWIDGQPNAKAFSRVTKNNRLRLSTSLLTNITCVVVGVFAATFYLKLFFKTHQDMTQYTSLADIINAVTIMCLDTGYKVFAVKMTNFENHRTDTMYEDAIILKLFIFGFFNSYCPSIYIAFLKSLLGDECNYNSCMGELGQSLMIIFVSRLLTGLVIKILIPQTREWWHRWFEDRRLRASEAANTSGSEDANEVMTSTEDQFYCEAYSDVFDDYNELSVQFGYICLFAPAFPLSPLLAFVSNFCEIRADGYKLLKQMRRPWPHGAEDIGTWYYIFQTLTVLSVFSNAGIIFYTMDLFDALEREFRLGLFIAYICGTLVLRSFFTSMIEAYPEEVDIQLARQDVLVQKVIKRVPDEDVFADMLRMRHLRMKAKTRVSILYTDPRETQSKKKELEEFEKKQQAKGSCCVC